MTTACPPDPAVRAYLLGELPPAELDAVARHLEGCPRCDARAAALDTGADRVVAALRRTAGSVGPAGPGAPPTAVGEYQILAEVGRGGMGVVYHARHVRLNRQAAVKMILSGRYASPEDQMRFRIEGELLARLRHPNVVEVYETGQHAGRPFLALEWVGGGTLEKLLAGPPLPPGRAAELAERLAEAVQHAHQNGVIHRDLKPANVLLAEDGTPKVTDFGLARPLAADAAGLTATGTVMGTPSYMAPEQARGDRAVGPAADVYALGAVLFALLTGRPPFQGPTPVDVLLAVMEDPPPSASQLRRGLPRDLDTIARRCLEKDPARRYPSAGELAADLRRWRTGRPILARPVPFWERAYRFARRHPAPTAAATLTAAAVVGAFVWVEQSREAEAVAREREAGARRAAERGERAAREAGTAEADARRLAERREALAAADRAVLRCEAGELPQGLAGFAHALELAERSGDADLARAVRVNQTAWAVRVPRQVRMFDPPNPGYAIRTAAFLDGGRTLATGGGDHGLVKLWPVAGGPPRELPRPTWLLRRPDASAVFPDPAGQVLYVAQGDNRIRRWNPVNLAPAGPDLLFAGLNTSIQDAAISPDGGRLAAGEERGTARVWDAATGRPLGPDLVHTPPGKPSDGREAVTAVAFAGPDTLLTGGRKNGVIVWDLPAGTERTRFDPGSDVFRLAVSPDGQTVVVGCEAEASAWLVRDPTRPVRVWPHPARVEGVAVSPDGRLAATGDHAGNVRVWELATGEPFARFRHPDQVRLLRFTPDGRGLVVGGRDGTSALWELPAWPTLAHGRLPGVRNVPGAGITPDGRVWAVSTAGLHIWEVRGEALTVVSRPLRPTTASKTVVWSGAVSPDGKLAATGGWFGDTTRVWDVASGRPVGTPLPHQDPVAAVGFLPDGRTLFTCQDDRSAGRVQWWRVVGDDRVVPVPGWPPLTDALCVAPHADGRRVLVGRRAGQPTGLWEVATGAAAGPPLPHPAAVTAAAVSPEGTMAATGGQEGGVRVWDLATGQVLGRPGFHTDRVNRIAWGPAGTLATASDDGTARVWDVRTMLPLGPPLRHPTAVGSVAYDPAGRRLVTVSRAGGVSVWPAESP
ncbi:MAG: protein kinase [Gemmataceae bacterium]